MAEYAAAKKCLFEIQNNSQVALINTDTEWGEKISEYIEC